MDEDGPIGRDGGFESLPDAVGRAKRELGLVVTHSINGVQNWVAERWLPIRLTIIGGFGWTTSRAFGWLWNRLAEFVIWLASSLAGTDVSSISGTQILLLFFVIHVLHSGIQTKLILGIKTKMPNMDSGSRSDVRTDGGNSEDFSYRGGAIGGIAAGAIIGWSFGPEGAYICALLGWVLGDEFDRRFEAKVNAAERTRREERAEKQ